MYEILDLISKTKDKFLQSDSLKYPIILPR